MDSIEVSISKPLARYDFIRLLGYCIKYPDGSLYKKEGDITKVLVRTNHYYVASQLLNAYGITILKEQKAELKAKVETDDKQFMPVVIKVLENGFDVDENGRCSFIPFGNVETFITAMYEEIESSKTEMVEPRRMWALLDAKYKCHPEIDDAIEVIRNSDIDQTKKDYLTTGLLRNRASLFEGVRVKKGDNNTYYSMYNLPCLILKRMSLLGQILPNRELFFQKRLIDMKDIDWKTMAKEMFKG